ncbi:efflux transporter outer membrane subunit [Verrucomicrobiaceae bacterium R5-34]|nr:efflux transporter outer membrane subunit [Verrucomicrobiaceae bacterium R5-34]
MKRLDISWLTKPSLRSGMVLPLVVAGLTGCQTMDLSKQPTQPVKLPQSWQHGADFPQTQVNVDLAQWWSEFHDPVLTELIRDSLASNPDLKSAFSAVREARARRSIEKSGLLPTLNGVASASGSRSKDSSSSSTTYSSTEVYSAGLQASWEVDLFGKQQAAVAAAQADLASSVATRESVQASLTSEVALAYVTLRSAEARMKVVQENVKNFEQTYQLASWKEQAGQTDSLDAQQAKSNLEQLRSTLPSLEQTIGNAKNSLTLMAGKTPGALDKLLAKRSGKVPEPPRKLAVGIPADTVRQRPDVRSAGYSWLAAVYRTDAAEAEKMPSLTLSGSLGVDSDGLSKLLRPEQAAASVIAGLTAPIFDGGKIRSQIEVQSEQEEQAWQSYKSSVLTAFSEVEDALIACQKNEQRAEITQRALQAAENAEQLARQSYEAGVEDIDTVLNTQRALLSIQEQVVTVQGDRSSSFVALYKALGGGWQR